MKKEKFFKKILFAVFIALVLSQSMAMAGQILPESSFWQGGRNYDDNGVIAFVEYAVYETASIDYHDTFDGLIDGFPDPGIEDNDFIYAYQVFNLGEDLAPILTFELLGGNPDFADGIGSMDDGAGGIVPSNDGTTFVWTFDNGFFVFDDQSAFMVFSSDAGPVEGDFRLTSGFADFGDEPPVNDIPEPTTVVLLATGSCMIFRKKRIVN